MSLIQSASRLIQGAIDKRAGSVSRAATRALGESSEALNRKIGRGFGADALQLSKSVRSSTIAKEFEQGLAQKGLKSVQPLHPRVQAQWAQSRANAARYKEETLQVLTEKLGSRAKAETKYAALYQKYKKDMYMAANYTDRSFSEAIRDGKVRSLYDIPLKTQIQKKGMPYVVSRNVIDLMQGIRKENPLYVTIAGNKKFARDIAKYGNMTVEYKEADLAARTLFSDGNHNYIFNETLLKELNPREALRKKQFTWFDAPHLVINRIVKEALVPDEQSRLIEGLVFDGINPRTAGKGLKVLRNGPKVDEVLDEVKKLGWRVSSPPISR